MNALLTRSLVALGVGIALILCGLILDIPLAVLDHITEV